MLARVGRGDHLALGRGEPVGDERSAALLDQFQVTAHRDRRIAHHDADRPVGAVGHRDRHARRSVVDERLGCAAGCVANADAPQRVGSSGEPVVDGQSEEPTDGTLGRPAPHAGLGAPLLETERSEPLGLGRTQPGVVGSHLVETTGVEGPSADLLVAFSHEPACARRRARWRRRGTAAARPAG